MRKVASSALGLRLAAALSAPAFVQAAMQNGNAEAGSPGAKMAGDSN
jgi:hypothetical protein